jgi:hypothetical protein
MIKKKNLQQHKRRKRKTIAVWQGGKNLMKEKLK